LSLLVSDDDTQASEQTVRCVEFCRLE